MLAWCVIHVFPLPRSSALHLTMLPGPHHGAATLQAVGPYPTSTSGFPQSSMPGNVIHKMVHPSGTPPQVNTGP